jgi:hypothetical protein
MSLRCRLQRKKHKSRGRPERRGKKRRRPLGRPPYPAPWYDPSFPARPDSDAQTPLHQALATLIASQHAPIVG